MSYDPFERGRHPVGVRSPEVTDASRDRTLPLEVWYPAEDSHRGADLREETRDRYRTLAATPELTQDAVRDATPESGRFPIIAFSHGFGGHRRQTTHLCTHFASHGYVVVAVDHVGNTMLDLMQAIIAIQTGSAPSDPAAMIEAPIRDRPLDLRFAIDALIGGAGELGDAVDPERIGVTGHSFGGWTTLMVAGQDDRIHAALPLAPAGGRSPLPAQGPERALDLDWSRDVPTLYLVADRDTILPLDGMHDLRSRTRGKSRMVILEDADHLHFCDRVEEQHTIFRTLMQMAPPAEGIPDAVRSVPPMEELCPGEHAYDYLRGLGLAHMDAHVKQRSDAAEFLEGDVESALGERGVRVKVV